MTWRIEKSSLGRIVQPEGSDNGVTVFCTTIDFEGRLSDSTVSALQDLLSERFAFNGPLATCSQVHGAEVAIAGSDAGSWCETPGCDALVSGDEPVALAIKVADCLPVVLFDTEHSRIANVHSGWRGAASRVVPVTLEKMSILHSSRPPAIRVWLGPSIRVCCFEVGEEVVDSLSEAYGDVEPFVDRSFGSKPHVDLAGLTGYVLENAGVDRSSIDDSGLCTRCEGSIFHSYRRDRESSGRNLMVIAG